MEYVTQDSLLGGKKAQSRGNRGNASVLGRFIVVNTRTEITSLNLSRGRNWSANRLPSEQIPYT